MSEPTITEADIELAVRLLNDLVDIRKACGGSVEYRVAAASGIVEHYFAGCRTASVAAATAKLRAEINEICQLAGKALNYPPAYPEASLVDDGSVCIGEHAPVTIVAELCTSLRELRVENERMLAALAKCAMRPKYRYTASYGGHVDEFLFSECSLCFGIDCHKADCLLSQKAS